MTDCPRCHRPLTRTTAIIPGRVVLACRHECRMMTVEVEGMAHEWVPAGEGWLERLRAMVAAQEQTRAIIDSDDGDPRWTEVFA